MPKKNDEYSKSLKKQKITNILLFSNTPKKSLKAEGLSTKQADAAFKKHLKTIS